jgi:glutamyl-tRNA reductase
MRSIHRVLVLLGASYHDLELTRLQALAAGAEQLPTRLARAQSNDADPIRGLVVLATCNRVEVYLDAHLFHDAVDAVTAELAAATGLSAESISATLEVRVGAPVAAHLFAVSAGLDSMVVGEAEIAGQVGRALTAAQRAGTVSPTLNMLFQRASRTAKQVQSRTDLGAAGRSVASVALDVAEAVDGPFAGRSALIVGTGAYARVALAALRARGCTDVAVYSTGDRAVGFAERHDVRPVSADELTTAVKSVDLIVACSGHRGAVLTGQLLDASGRDRPLTIVDLALQRDVADDVRARPSVRVVDLLTVAQQAPDGETGAVAAAQDLVIGAVAEFEDTQAVRVIDPAVIALRTHISGVVQKEMERLRVKFDDDVAAELELAMHRVTRSMLHTPTMRAQQLARTGDAAGYVAALHTLFGIDLSPSPQP